MKRFLIIILLLSNVSVWAQLKYKVSPKVKEIADKIKKEKSHKKDALIV